MLYFKNSELAETYHVSLRTVLNWIEAAKNNKLDLLLHERNGRSYIANTTHNITAIEKLVEKRRKYRNTRSFKVTSPTPEFYKIYSPDQVLGIFSNLETYHEIPFQYSYYDIGAKYWDNYVHRLDVEANPNSLNSTRKLLSINGVYIDHLIQGTKTVNVIDMGVGNAYPVRGIIQCLLDKGVMGKYIAVDISGAMLKIAKKNIQMWFGDKVEVEVHELDFSYQRIHHILAKEYINNKEPIINLVAILGGTLNSLRFPDEALHALHESMSSSDLLIETRKFDTPNSRQHFDFNSNPRETRLADNDRMVLDLLDIDESCYDVEAGFDAQKRERYIRVRLKVALTIEFSFSGVKKLVHLNKDDQILLWRVWHTTPMEIIDQYERTGFHPLQTSQVDDYMLTISKIKI